MNQAACITKPYSESNVLAFLVNAFEKKKVYFENNPSLFYQWFLGVMSQDLDISDFDLTVEKLSDIQEKLYGNQHTFREFLEHTQKEIQRSLGLTMGQGEQSQNFLNSQHLTLAILIYQVEFFSSFKHLIEGVEINFVEKLKNIILKKQEYALNPLIPIQSIEDRETLLNKFAQNTNERIVSPDQLTCFQIQEIYLKNAGINYSVAEQVLVEFSLAMAINPFVNSVFSFLKTQTFDETIAHSLGLSIEEYEEVVNNSERSTMFLDTSQHTIVPMHRFWTSWFTGGESKTLDGNAWNYFIKPIDAFKNENNNVNAMGQIDEESKEVIGKLLTQAYIQNETSPRQNNWETTQADVQGGFLNTTHILLYGSSILNKKEIAKKLGKDSDSIVFMLNPNIPEELKRDGVYLALRILSSGDKNALLVIPDAQKILTRNKKGHIMFQLFSMEVEQEAEETIIDREIMNSTTPCLWIVNDPSSINENSLGRFIYSAEVRPLSREARILEVKNVLEPLGVREEFIKEVSSYININENLLKSAIAFTERTSNKEELYLPEFVEKREALLKKAIKQGQRLLGRGQKENLRASTTSYSLDYLNLESRFKINDIMTALKRHEKGSLCFYGIPGTGKTMLAEHISATLNKPLMIKRASDILGKYVGESEKAIAQMFQDATESESILLLDEADTFLRDRRLSSHSWESSIVNELLQAMERFEGIFICTTNMFERLDAASLRRFTFKLKFLEMTPEQRWEMFVTELKLDVNFHVRQIEDWKLELNNIKMLAPGDFSTIQRQNMLFDKVLTPDQYLYALKEEVKYKMLDHEMAYSSSRPDTH